MSHAIKVQLIIIGIYILTSIAWVVGIILIYKKIIKRGRLKQWLNCVDDWITKRENRYEKKD